MSRRIAFLLAALATACRPTPSTTPPPRAAEPTPGALADAHGESEPEPEPEPTAQAIQLDLEDPPDPPPLPPLPDRIAAKVGAVEITIASFREIYDLKVVKYTVRGRTIPQSADARYRKSIVERLVYHEVLKQEAAALGVKYDKTRLAAREAQQKDVIADWKLHLERRGETETSLREMYIAELREEAILETQGKLALSQPEIEGEYVAIKEIWKSDRERVRASHILLPAAAGAEARRIHALARKKGADFAALARKHGTGPSAAKGGDVGIFTKDRMAEEFSDAAFALKVGDVSKPVRTKFGWHIIKLTGRWPAGYLPIDALREDIISRLRQRKIHAGRLELKDDLLAKYTIVDHITPK